MTAEATPGIRPIAAALWGVVALMLALLAPDVLKLANGTLEVYLPFWVCRAIRVGAWVATLAALIAWLTRRPRLFLPGVPLPGAFWRAVDGSARWLLDRGLAPALAVAALALLAGWLPHYLNWPWWADIGYFALAAQSWDAGLKPYQDLYDFNFPGPIYVHWLIGKVVGWGRTTPFYAADAALLITLGLALIGWSRRRFGTAVPGLVGYLGVLAYYLNLDYQLAAQRDWHAPLLVVLGLLALEALPAATPGVVAGSALAFALALAHRPHVVLLLPAMLSALQEHVRGGGAAPPGATIRAASRWCAIVALGGLALAAPLAAAGVVDDFLYWFQRAWYGGNYNQAAPQGLLAEIRAQVGRTPTLLALVGLVLLAAGRGQLRPPARTWLLALGFALLYQPLSPVRHAYLYHPVRLIEAVSLAVVAAWVVATSRLVTSARVVVLGLLLMMLVPGVPRHCRPRDSLAAVADLWHVRWPAEPPSGCNTKLLSSRVGGDLPGNHVAWNDYVATLRYVRATTGPRDRVATFFRSEPFPIINAPTGRLTPFPSPAGILWLRFVAPERELEFARSLEHPDATLVVWAPRIKPEPRLATPRIEETVRRHYHVEARFGSIEIWRRNGADPPDHDESQRFSHRKQRIDDPMTRTNQPPDR